MFCYCPTTEGEPELTTSQSVPLHWCHDETGAMMRDLIVDQYHMVYPEWNGSALT